MLGLSLALSAAAVAQTGDQRPARAGAGPQLVGIVTAVAADRVTMKTSAGDSYEVIFTATTRARKGADTLKLADIHAGDSVTAMGEVDPTKKTVTAANVFVVDAETLKKAREAMGKTMIAGTVTAIDELKLTIKRTDDEVQVIQVDEDTSFKKGGPGGFGGAGFGGAGRGQRPGAAAPATADAAESLTLADVKVGSVVAGKGSLKNGIFVPTELNISDPAAARQRRRPDGTGAAGAPATTPGSQTPGSPNPQNAGPEPK